MARVLEGIRILDFSRYGAGPYCAMLLADMGAEVIKVERIGGEDDRTLGPLAPNGQSFRVLDTGRNKKGITLNLQREKGRQILNELVKQSDVVIESFPCGVAQAIGLGYDSLRKANPAIILVSISGFGRNGPYSQRVGFDAVAQAMSGAMSRTGFLGQPPTRAAAPYVDFSTGALAALGAMLALYHRERTGTGQMVDLALMDTAVSFMANFIAEYKVFGVIHPQIGNSSFYAGPYNTFKLSDGYIFIGVIGDAVWRRFLKVIGKEELAADPRFQSNSARGENRHLVDSLVDQWLANRTTEEALGLLEKADIPCGPVYDIPQVVENPQVKAREMIVDIEYPDGMVIPLSGVPMKFSETPGEIRTRAPSVGEHNLEVYSELLGYSPEEIDNLRREKII